MSLQEIKIFLPSKGNNQQNKLTVHRMREKSLLVISQTVKSTINIKRTKKHPPNQKCQSINRPMKYTVLKRNSNSE